MEHVLKKTRKQTVRSLGLHVILLHQGEELTWRTDTCILIYIFIGPTAHHWLRTSSFSKFLDHTQRRTIVGRTPLDERSARCRDLYLTTHNTHNRQTSMPFHGFRAHNPSKRAAADLRLRPRGHWKRQHFTILLLISKVLNYERAFYS